MKYQRILAAIQATPWAILPTKLDEIRALVKLRASGGKVKAKDIEAVMAGRKPDGVQMMGRVAVLPVMGVISQRVGMVERASGGVSTEELGATLDALVADKTVKCIVMAFDSPGGSVLGVAELAAKIRAARDEKKIVGIADSIAASACYWFAAQCSELTVTPGGQVGSIGVIAVHTDESKALEMEGLKPTVITSSQFKGEGSPDQPLSDDARAEMQKKVNAYHAMFVDGVAKGRGVSVARVEKDFGQGRMMMAQEAVAAGMADRVGTFEQVLKRLGADTGSPGAGAYIPELMAKRHADAKARARAVEIE